MKRVHKLLATLGSVLALVGIFATMAFAAPDNSEPLDEDPDDSADRETVEVLADSILLIDVRNVENRTSDDETGHFDHTFSNGNLNPADAFGADSDPAAGDRYFEYKEEAVMDLTSNLDTWTLEVCNGGNGGDGNWLGGNATGHSRGFSEFTEAGADGDQETETDSASFFALKTQATSSTENNVIIAQGPNASADHPTWDYIDGSGNSPELPGHNPEDGTDCDGSGEFTYTGPEPGSGSTADNNRDGIADEDFNGSFSSVGIPFEYVVGYDAIDGTVGGDNEPDSTTVLWTLTAGSLSNE